MMATIILNGFPIDFSDIPFDCNLSCYSQYETKTGLTFTKQMQSSDALDRT